MPAIVTLHLIGGLVLLALLCVQAVQHTRAAGGLPPVGLSQGMRWALWGTMALLAAQVVLGGWVSTNYAVLACTTFPKCQGSWWPAMDATTLEGGAGALVDLKGQWLLVSVADSQCDTDCQKHLYLQRQLRESVGREKDRVDWVWLVTDDKAPPAALEPALKQAQVRRVDEAALAQWLAPAAGQALRDHIYVVDPMGHWMMRFPARMDAAGAAKAKKDLERLLRASASWDEAGRPRKP